jgi:valyl-tRNA synthetase
MENRIGKMYYISYTVSSGESIAVATSRPETMYGDVALAVNPIDERYKHMI